MRNEVTTPKEWQRHQVDHLLKLVDHLLSNDIPKVLLSISRRLAFLNKLGEGVSVREADRFHHNLECSARPSENLRAEFEARVFQRNYPADVQDHLRKELPGRPTDGVDPATKAFKPPPKGAKKQF